ncbi:MAG: poly(3-hydroxyalkanoate) depolymerase [Panacagrimonas sp.]
MNAPDVLHPPPRKLLLKEVSVGGMTLRVAHWPGTSDPAPILLFNGIGGNFELLTPFVAALGKVEVISFDMPGIGGSTLPPYPYRMSTIARLAVHVLKKMGHERADVIGVSWGGALAQQFAHTAPSRCRRLVLCATMAGAPIAWPAAPSVFWKLLTPTRYLKPGNMEKEAGRLYGGRFRWDKALARDYASRIRKPSRAGYMLQLGAITGWTSALWLWRLRQPTLVLVGADDPICPPINGHILAKLIPNSRLEVMDEGHLFVIAQPQIAADLVHEFLDTDNAAQTTSEHRRPWSAAMHADEA